MVKQWYNIYEICLQLKIIIFFVDLDKWMIKLLGDEAA